MLNDLLINEYKNKIMTKLHSINVTKVIVYYSGSGDSGGIDDIQFYINEQHQRQDTSFYSNKNNLDVLLDYENKDITIHDFIYEFTDNLLQHLYGSWYNDDGGNGEVHYLVNQKDIDQSEIIVNHNEVYTEYNTHRNKF